MKTAVLLATILATPLLAAPAPTDGDKASRGYGSYGDYAGDAPDGGYSDYGDYGGSTPPPADVPPPAGGYGDYGDYKSDGYASYGAYRRSIEFLKKLLF